MSQDRKVFRLLLWLKACGDIYGVHNSYNFMMAQRWDFFLKWNMGKELFNIIHSISP